MACVEDCLSIPPANRNERRNAFVSLRDPYYTTGDAQRYAYWYDLGSSLRPTEYAYQDDIFSNRGAVSLVEGHVVREVADPVMSLSWMRRML
jgi:hypothetical protein